jgi:hypothetical protein
MSPQDHVPAATYDRFQRIYRALTACDPRWWTDAAWLRFAAQAAVLVPGGPEEVAERIHVIADGLRAHAPWWSALQSPLRYVIAALAVQSGDDPKAFEAEIQRLQELYRALHIRRGDIHEIVSMVLLRIGAHRQPVGVERVRRFHELYRQLKSRHWWLTGPHDLSACAVLIDLPGTPEAIGELVEHLYGALRSEGFARGFHLETAAHILALADEPVDAAIARFRNLSKHMTVAVGSHGPISYDAVAVLSLLRVPMERVVLTALALRQELGSLRPVLHDQIQIDITADLTFLSLVGEDVRLVDQDPAVLRRIIECGQKAAVIVACFGATSNDPASY